METRMIIDVGVAKLQKLRWCGPLKDGPVQIWFGVPTLISEMGAGSNLLA